MFRLVYLLLITRITVIGFQQATDSTDPERAKDAYAIYSLMLTNPTTSHGRDNSERF
jgi:hypothetical protein